MYILYSLHSTCTYNIIRTFMSEVNLYYDGLRKHLGMANAAAAADGL